MMTEVVRRRDYDSSARKAGSDETKRRILDAARASIVTRGYRATKIADVAEAAEVHVATVYELVGKKPVLLRELLEQAISGADRAVPPEERDYVTAMRAERDPAGKLAIYAAAMRAIHRRMAPLFVALRDAASTEPEAAAVWRDISSRRATNMRRLVRDLAEAGGLRPDLTVDEAADFIWATNSPEIYVMLTAERGWTPARYESWLADLWARFLLPTP
ncbi:MAG TPA: helix-turn-helix domain-containing protein [Acidimicrobiales bacterium]|jgi:AcrR family transcriptional regulator|nr:helix-turn-helix domain-containing protein [Acidimicrobiales bacterium]